MIKKLRIFDFDDTIFETEGKVILKKPSGETIEMTPAEYALYEPEAGDSFDFSQFSRVINPKLIRPVAKRFYKIVSAGTDNRSYVILTARGTEAIPHIKEIIKKYFNEKYHIKMTDVSFPLLISAFVLLYNSS